MKFTDQDVIKLARRAAAHVGAGVESMEISAAAMEKLMWELVLLRKRQESASFSIDLPVNTSEPDHATQTCPGTLRAMSR